MNSIPMLLVEGQSLVDKMIASSWFPGTTSQTTAAQTAITALDAAAATAQSGTPADTQAMYVCAETTRVKIRVLLLTVDTVAINNPSNSLAIISAAGLQAKRTGSRNIQTIAVKAGTDPGSVVVRVKAHKRFSYKIQMQKGNSVEPTGWVDVTVTTVVSIPVAGLAPLTQYWFRVALIKGLSQGAYSNPVSISMPA